MALKETWEALRSSPVDTLFKWQNQRFLWILMAAAMGGMVFLAHAFFQVYLYMPPCEQCVYIRFAMLVMMAGGLIAAINPKNIVLKLMGCVAAFYGSITGILYSLKLNKIHHAIHDPAGDFFGVQGCSMEPSFPFELPLAKWAPEWFSPTGDCGYDAPIVPGNVTLDGVQQWFVNMYTASEGWYLIPSLKFMNMAQACFMAFGMILAAIIIMAVVWSIKAARASL
ncbi:MAG: protein-disulfide oxidoreductase DsbI [Burkholderiales bacterium]|jgi:disulfide bond formation protein DsbB|nr:protein-disulfide oxidoreductase DsbI [Burkholderiales bacterium]